MSFRIDVEGWIRRHRTPLFAAWAAIGVAMVALIALLVPDVYYLRGIAPWPRIWMIAFVASLWCWIGLRVIALWIWAWVVMALAPLCLFIPLRFYLDAWWLMPLLGTVVVLSLVTVVAVVAWKHRQGRQEGPIAALPRPHGG